MDKLQFSDLASALAKPIRALPMLTLTMPAEDDQKDRAYRRRLAAKGRRQVIVDLPGETVALIDELKQRQGLRSRSQVLQQLIERGRAATQQIT